jgi:hypothetical protein
VYWPKKDYQDYWWTMNILTQRILGR